jgi:hypothetical protein
LSQYEYQIGVKLYELRSCNGQLNTANKTEKTQQNFTQEARQTAI